jgi:hypothetical protein
MTIFKFIRSTATRPSVREEPGEATVLADADHDAIIVATAAGGLVVTVPAGLTAGTTVEFVQGSTVAVSVVAGMGMTLLYPAAFDPITNEESSTLVITILSDTTAIVRGDLAAA